MDVVIFALSGMFFVNGSGNGNFTWNGGWMEFRPEALVLGDPRPRGWIDLIWS